MKTKHILKKLVSFDFNKVIVYIEKDPYSIDFFYTNSTEPMCIFEYVYDSPTRKILQNCFQLKRGTYTYVDGIWTYTKET